MRKVIRLPRRRRRLAPLQIKGFEAMLAYCRDWSTAIERGQTFTAEVLLSMLRSVRGYTEEIEREIESPPRPQRRKRAS